MALSGCGTNQPAPNPGTQGQKNSSKQNIVQQQTRNAERISLAENDLDHTYYKTAIGKSGAELKQALNDIISKQEVISYRDATEALRDTDEDPNNKDNVLLLYAGRSVKKANYDSQWNKEHVWAKSHGDFGTGHGMGSDLHNLRAEDPGVNSDRGRLDFDKSDDEYPKEEAPDTHWDQDSWEPRDEVKGDVARIILYMDTRYDEDDWKDLKVVDRTVRDKSPLHGKLSALLKWHNEDAVDDFERRRNNVIYEKYQHNRNPFIDHPEWVNQIWGGQQ
ncbi:endonuclease I family protein [Paenibacillus pinihumi]|uniref:endonuclease I family protein n=1 Tax=Paenibacillus pinihumi TaxID=669462 RepID=UPI003CCC1C7B